MVRLPAFVLLVLSFHSALFARFRRCTRFCWTPLVISKSIIAAPRRLGPCTKQSFWTRTGWCLGCLVYLTGQKPTTSSRARLLGAKLQATDHYWAYIIWSDHDPPSLALISVYLRISGR